MTHLDVRLDLPRRWRLSLTADGDGFGVNLVQRKPEPEPERPKLEGGQFLVTDERGHASFGFTAPRWSPLEGTEPDP